MVRSTRSMMAPSPRISEARVQVGTAGVAPQNAQCARVVVAHDRARDEQQNGQHGQRGDCEEDPVAVQTPDQNVHRATSRRGCALSDNPRSLPM